MTPDVMHQVLNIVKKSALELLRILCAFGLLDELHPGPSVPPEEHDLQDFEKMVYVRAGYFQCPLDLHHRPPR